MKQQKLISADAKLKIIAIHKQTFEEHETIMSYSDYNIMYRNPKFYYKAIAL